jgi:hypothetical protein
MRLSGGNCVSIRQFGNMKISPSCGRFCWYGCPEGPFHGILGIIGIEIPLIAAPVIDRELEDARVRCANSASSDDKYCELPVQGI